MTETSDSELVSTRQRRIAQLAKQMPEKGLTSLNQHLDVAWLREAFRRTRKDGAAGVDGQTAADYERNLESNLLSLLERAKSGTYWAPPVRRVRMWSATPTTLWSDSPTTKTPGVSWPCCRSDSAGTV